MSELKPCPFCGASGNNVQVRFIGFPYLACGYKAGYRGECCECHALTAAFDNYKDAVAAWNRRPQKRCSVWGGTVDMNYSFEAKKDGKEQKDDE